MLLSLAWPSTMHYYLILSLIVVSGSVKAGKNKQHWDQYDSMGVARCVVKCTSDIKNEEDVCVSACLKQEHVKPGVCPDINTLSDFEAACIDVCQIDAKCPATKKCCSNKCGFTCQQAHGLDVVAGLPPVPTNLSILERKRGRQVYVEWSGVKQEAGVKPVVYLLEERHHIGLHFSASRLGPWMQRHRPTPHAHTLLKHVLNPGRWYQFRVAAINEIGTQGFSHTSAPFTLSIVPKAPRPPEKLAVGSLRKLNGYYYGKLTWEAPISDLPIQRYKVYWSRQLPVVSGPLVSVLVNHQTVAKDVTSFTLQHLEPDSMYFLQVQALSQYGRDRLKGEKSAMVLNTTMQMLESTLSDTATKRSFSKVSNLRVQRMFWKDGQLWTRLSWVPQEGQKSRFTVTWWQGSCQGKSQNKKIQLAANTESPNFNLYNLSFRCKYRVTVHQHGSEQQQDATLVFVTPTCQQLAASIKRAEKPTCSLSTEEDILHT